MTSSRTEGEKGYDDMSEKMIELAEKQEGFLGIEFARNERGRSTWYQNFKVRISKVERDYEF